MLWIFGLYLGLHMRVILGLHKSFILELYSRVYIRVILGLN